ncbi:hypothetical protein [Acidovorax sp. NCPPB 3576]|uniref:hypothetical protein n=1 Tax=Acidovorax sp. NCPPB 3576 TaxID=2940488 RepID=UPI00234993A3|nr:hypothetical protein [Acidovorax sp. NCPPB 3576]WCM88969.1 hypothetical protein M5C98_02625 [Acidovorax sp. NCPPB 3576]
MSTKVRFCLLGTGSVFDMIAEDAAAYGLPEGWTMRRVDDVAALSAAIPSLLEGLEPGLTSVFAAVDQNALNYARLELYGAARLRGLHMATLIHERAIVAPSAQLADNVWVGPGAIIGRATRIAGDVMVHAGARIDAGAHVGMHGFIGPGASVGENTAVGPHCVIGSNVHLGASLQFGRHCVIDVSRQQTVGLAAGSFIATHFPNPARMIGAGYTYERRR